MKALQYLQNTMPKYLYVSICMCLLTLFLLFYLLTILTDKVNSTFSFVLFELMFFIFVLLEEGCKFIN